MSFALPPELTLRWLYVDFNSYFASVEQELDPRLRGLPVIVVPVETDATCAIAASYEAKAFGIRTGTPVHEAKRLCPGLICVLAKHERYVEFHQNILKEVDRHIPVTAVCSIDEVACRLMDNETSPERATQIALSLKRGLAERVGRFVRCSIGIAPNRYLAKVATDLHKPDGLTLLGAGDLPHRLYGLALRDLPGIGRNMEHRIRMQGIGSLPALMAQSPKRMRQIWGSVWGEKMWYLLRGAELPEDETTRSSVGHSHVLSPELRDPSQALFVARRLTLKATARLRRLGYYATDFHLSVRTEVGLRHEASGRCWRAQDTLTFLHLLEQCWQSVRHSSAGARFKKVSVLLSGLVAADTLTPELFDQLPGLDLARRAKSERMSRALDKLNLKYGRDTILVGMLPAQGRSFSGSKIAFTRIPDADEFKE